MNVRRAAAAVATAVAVTTATIGTTAAAAPPAATSAATSMPAQATAGSGITAARQIPTPSTLLRRQIDALLRAGVSRAAVRAAAAAAEAQTTVNGRTALNGRTADDGSTGVIVASASTSAAVLSQLEPAGHLHGRSDALLDVRYPVSHGKPLMQVLARRASTGQLLWQRSVGLARGEFAVPMPMLTGRTHRPGVVVLRVAFGKTGNGLTMTMTLTGWSGTGRTLWQHRESGSFDDSGVHHFPGLDGQFQQSAAAADALLLTRLDDRSQASTGTPSSAKLTPVRLDTGTGRASTYGASLSSSNGYPTITMVGDLDGDGYTDTVATSPGSGVSARDGHDARQLWSNSNLTLNADATAWPVGDVHASPSGSPRADDVAVTTGTPTPGPLGELGLPDPTAPAHGDVVLLDGATGGAVWTKAGDLPYAVGTAGASHVPATGVVSSDTSGDATGTGTTTETLTLTTYDDSGATVYTRSYKVSVNGDGNGGSVGFGDAYDVGDIEPDRSLDGIAFMFASDGNNETTKAVTFHGIDGAPFPSGAGDVLGPSTTGHGEDFVTVTTRHGVALTVRRGRDLGVLFHRGITGTSGVTAAEAWSAQLDGADRADVLVTGAGKHKAVAALLDPAGRVRWRIIYDPTKTAAGTLRRG